MYDPVKAKAWRENNKDKLKQYAKTYRQKKNIKEAEVFNSDSAEEGS